MDAPKKFSPSKWLEYGRRRRLKPIGLAPFVQGAFACAPLDEPNAVQTWNTCAETLAHALCYIEQTIKTLGQFSPSSPKAELFTCVDYAKSQAEDAHKVIEDAVRALALQGMAADALGGIGKEEGDAHD